ncbi:formate dehydrogenase accessory sulfurtransferase FdhD [Abyssalbus ytuae]|uniref:Sulfur carrier protein FdhD n=1 Tax=Abyssalbus ytuae TaxID=2926907 RepID=A0A9E6ZN84_9FLAO|nr:formate dehydrogenase accessory sulfurtransferase FdhD [Abyssalbus ytuae]UOB17415.1 formate dehydrogenase accessory sulfurtransferase FdhD [Abyssalbus ytuae]
MNKVKNHKILKINKLNSKSKNDLIVVEEPLQIKLHHIQNGEWVENTLSITMRTPGNDFDLVIGFLFNENIISSNQDILQIRYCNNTKEEEKQNIIIVKLSPNITLDFNKLNKHFYTTSSCGVCGKTGVDFITRQFNETGKKNDHRISREILWELGDKLIQKQTVFKFTGGIHGCALFDLKGELLLAKEDIGRHNALDKLIGEAFLNELLPLNNHILFLSGRISFELVQKAVKAGIPFIVAVGAPSSLSVQLAHANNITLTGFHKENSFNVYTHTERIIDTIPKSV